MSEIDSWPRERLTAAIESMKALRLRNSRARCERSLAAFVREGWSVVEPGNDYVEGWHIRAMCEHLEAVERGEVNRLLINVPPGAMKSLLCGVFFPAWLWGPRHKPYLRFLCASHSQSLAIRDSTKMRRLIQSEWYQTRWPVKLTGDQNAKQKFETAEAGFREAIAAGSITGARGDIVLLDDPHSVEGAASEQMRQTTAEWFLEAVPTRLNNPAESSIIVIMQRLHAEDVSGIILDRKLGYCHLMLPMEFDPLRRCETEIGFRDPRTDEGELLFPERFPAEVVERDKKVLGPWAVSGQFQQAPTPRGGGILRREWFVTYDEDAAREAGVNNSDFPPMEYIVASVDPGYSEKAVALHGDNDPSGFSIWGLFRNREGYPRLMLMDAWSRKLDLHGADVERYAGETLAEWKRRTSMEWGLCEWIAYSCGRYPVDTLLIEAKASGISVAQEIRRLHRQEDFTVRLINPGRTDKVARAYAIQPFLADGTIYAPDRSWADALINECEDFPKGSHDDRVDSMTQAVLWFRESGMLQRGKDIVADSLRDATHVSRERPIYDV